MPDAGSKEGKIYAVEGWQERHPIDCRIPSRSFLRACREQVSYEVERFDQRFPEMEQKLARKGAIPKAVEDSKKRIIFDLDIREGEARALPPEAAAQSAHSPAAPADQEAAPGPVVPETVNMRPAHWLAMRFPQGGILFDIESQDQALLQEIASHNFDVQRFHAGEGHPLPTLSLARHRHRPQPGSFGAWFLESAGASTSAILAFLLGPNSGEADLNLLRFRLSSHHVLVVSPGSSCIEPLLKTWDGTVYRMGEHLLFCDPGPSFLSPATGQAGLLGKPWPKISVITVSFNQATYLEECLLSVLQQDYPNFEYVVIDACSTDGSQDILRRYESRLDTLVIEPDDGQSDGLTKGFSHATGDILTWVNSDDLLAPGALCRVAVAFMHHGCDLVAGGCDRVTENTEDIIARHHSALPLERVVELGLHHNLMWHDSWEQGDYFFQPEVFFSADIWRRSGAYLKPHLYWAMDYELWIRMAMAGATVVHIPETLALSRMHDQQKTTQEALYLYQLKNILLEYDDLFQAIEKRAEGLPEGDFSYSRPVSQSGPAIEAPPRSLAGRIWGLRKPRNLAAALKRRLKPSTVNLLRRVWRLRDPLHAARAIDRRLPSFARSMGRAVLRKAKYSRRGYRIVSAVRLSELTTRSTMLAEVIAKANSDARLLEYTQTEMAQLQGHIADLKTAMETQQSIISEYTASVATLAEVDRGSGKVVSNPYPGTGESPSGYDTKPRKGPPERPKETKRRTHPILG